ncbi:MAG: hypothetical protein ACI8SR_001499 [Oceanicoccus sp.]|jgi:hypothetical protein
MTNTNLFAPSPSYQKRGTSYLVSTTWITACVVMTNTNLFTPSPSYQKRGTSYLVSTTLDYRLRGNDEYKPIRTLAVIPEARNELSGIHPIDYRLRGNDEYKPIRTFTRHIGSEERAIWYPSYGLPPARNGEYKLIHTLAVIPEARNELSGIHHIGLPPSRQ